MGKLLGMVASIVVYLCVGTIIAQVIAVSYAWSKGYVDRQKLLVMLAAAQSSDAGADAPKEKVPQVQDPEDSTFEDLQRLRSIKTRDLELREQALASGLDRMRFDRMKLAEERTEYDFQRTAFLKHLDNMKEGTLAQGRANVRLMMEKLKPKQAKVQLLEMLERKEETEVVAMLSEMPIGSRAKICAEFKTPDEIKKLDALLRMMREGIPEITQIDETREQLQANEPQKLR